MTAIPTSDHPAVDRLQPIAFTPGILAPDAFTAYWIRQAVLRLRREVCWAWRVQPGRAGEPDPVSEALDRSRVIDDRAEFFRTDPTANYLSELIAEDPPRRPRTPERGTLPWLESELEFNDAEVFTLALVLLHASDAAAGEVIATVQGDQRRTAPTLGLLQRLWDDPAVFLPLANRSHRLFQVGVVRTENAGAVDWHAALTMPALLANQLLKPSPRPPDGFQVVKLPPNQTLDLSVKLAALRLTERIEYPHLVPIRHHLRRGAVGSSADSILGAVSSVTGRPIFRPSSVTPIGIDLQVLAALCWLKGADLVVEDTDTSDAPVAPFSGVPIYAFMPTERTHLEFPGWRALPGLNVPELSVTERAAIWRRRLGRRVAPPDDAIRDCAFRFRFDEDVIREIAESLTLIGKRIDRSQLELACQQYAGMDPGGLAERVRPRFKPDELILPPAQHRQFEEVVTAMRSLAEVHSDWGTGRVWDDAGISALFAGPPGTGKTMAAEILAARLGTPMFRVDLSQVVNKYIGETEKNLRKLFDGAEECDALLFFDEADALFGQRTEVKNAHDRYANLEVSYLLQRMERFRGLAILATNRRKDLDDAFLRRLRFVIEFPLPDVAERRQIWRSAVPATVDTTDLDWEFLSHQFPLAGGHIRSIVFQACLQSAGGAQRLDMDTVMQAVKREYDKLDRKLTRDQIGRWGDV